MNKKLLTVLAAVMTSAVILAGCVDDGGDNGTPSDGGSEPVTLGNKGAISGLVVDDNYRPVQLKDDWGTAGPGDFQDVGFVLLVETGQRFSTNENGEFTAIPLEPGTYTLRVAADNHEAKEATIPVVAGEYAEITLEARREYSGGGTVLSQEHTLFSACFANVPVGGIALAALAAGCGDTSGDSSRFDFKTDYGALSYSHPDTHGEGAPVGDNSLRGMITEMRANSDGYYGIDIRIVGDGCDPLAVTSYCYYARLESEGGRYVHNVLYAGKALIGGEHIEQGQDGWCSWAEHREDGCTRYAWHGDREFQTALFARHPSEQFVEPVTGTWGAGIVFGVKAQFVQNVFLYDIPEEGIDEFCVLCDDYKPPE